MAHMMSPDQFAELQAQGAVMLDRARTLMQGQALVDRDTPAEVVVAHEETLATQLALMAIVKSSALDEATLMVALGDLCGSCVAQSLSAPHPELLRQLWTQLRSTYEQVGQASKPVGNA